MTIKLAIAGCTGRMGQTLLKAALSTDGITLVAGSERDGVDPAQIQSTLTSLGCANITVTSDPNELASLSDAIIDFTTPEATLSHAKAIADRGGVHIVGTTGFTTDQQKELERYGETARIVQAGNFSLGVNLLSMLTEKAASILDDIYDIEIAEMHHKHKVDAPSGTGYMLGQAAARGRNVSLDTKKVIDREGARKQGDIGFSVMRGGDVVGIHDVMFAGPGETITLKHQGFSRDIFANGAIHAAKWVQDKDPGHYSMQDVLGF